MNNIPVNNAAIDAVASGTSTVISDGINGNIQSGKDLGLSFASGFTSSLFSSATGFLLKKYVFFDFGVDQFESRPRGEKRVFCKTKFFITKVDIETVILPCIEELSSLKSMYIARLAGWIISQMDLYHLERALNSGNDE